MNRIEKAAIKCDGKVYSMDKPSRHNDIINFCRESGISYPLHFEQGFLDSNGVFLSRYEAYNIALEASQLRNGMIGSVLTSEDLW